MRTMVAASLIVAMSITSIGCRTTGGGDGGLDPNTVAIVKAAVSSALRYFEAFVEEDEDLSDDQRQVLVALATGVREALDSGEKGLDRRLKQSFGVIAESYRAFLAKKDMDAQDRAMYLSAIDLAEQLLYRLVDEVLSEENPGVEVAPDPDIVEPIQMSGEKWT